MFHMKQTTHRTGIGQISQKQKHGHEQCEAPWSSGTISVHINHSMNQTQHGIT
jgi:hypothetical protein